LIPLQTVIYVVHLEKAKKQDEAADLRRWNMVVKGDPDTWTFELRCPSKEDATKWVSKVQELVKRAQTAHLKRKATKVNIEYDLKGKFWKNVVNLTLTRDRMAEADQAAGSDSDISEKIEKMQNQHKLIKKGAIKKKSPKLGLWQARDVELYGDVLVYREKNKEDSSGAVPIWDIVEVKVEGNVRKTQFVVVVKSAEEKTRTFVFETGSEEAAAEWVAEINKAIQSAVCRSTDTNEDKTGRLIQSADREMQNHDYDIAVQILKEALEHNPESQQIKDKLQEARKLARKKFQESINPEARRLKLEGNDWFIHKNYLKARGCYDKAIELDSNNSLLYFNRSAANHFLCDPEAAEADARKAVDLDPESVDAHTRLGLSLLKMKKYEASREAYETALKLDPTDPRAMKGMTHLEKEERKAALVLQTPPRTKSIDSNSLADDPDSSQRSFSIKIGPLDLQEEDKSPLPPELLPSIRPSSPSLYPPDSPRLSPRGPSSPSHRGPAISVSSIASISSLESGESLSSALNELHSSPQPSPSSPIPGVTILPRDSKGPESALPSPRSDGSSGDIVAAQGASSGDVVAAQGASSGDVVAAQGASNGDVVAAQGALGGAERASVVESSSGLAAEPRSSSDSASSS